MSRILIVDDEKDIVSFIRCYFISEGYEILTAYNGYEAIEQIKYKPDIILLDINMPSLDGLETCKRIRNQVSCPIIFLTARVEDQDTIDGLLVGGDDYILKPFNIDVLGARVASHLRRENRRQCNEIYQSFGDVTINYTNREVAVNQQILFFTKKEYEIIELLSRHPGQVFDRERIYERVWGYDAEGSSISVTEHIKRIRGKVDQYTNKNIIETVWGVGYKWVKS